MSDLESARGARQPNRGAKRYKTYLLGGPMNKGSISKLDDFDDEDRS